MEISKWLRNLVEAICDTSLVRGELGGIWEAPGGLWESSGGVWGLSGDLGCLGGLGS